MSKLSFLIWSSSGISTFSAAYTGIEFRNITSGDVPPAHWARSLSKYDSNGSNCVLILMFGYLFLIWSVKPLTRSMPVRLVWSWAMIATSPSPPINSAILSAARAAAAILSVAAVLTGISLSTPESKPMTGMLAALAFSSSGIKALESTAARQMAAGFLSSAVWNISTCLSTMASVSGPSNVMVTFRSVAACSAPFLTACQNWCWKPFEITGM